MFGYQDRVKQQVLLWAMGKSRHNHIDGECCPDFSCCYPDLFEENDAERWGFYKKRYGVDNVR